MSNSLFSVTSSDLDFTYTTFSKKRKKEKNERKKKKIHLILFPKSAKQDEIEHLLDFLGFLLPMDIDHLH